MWQPESNLGLPLALQSPCHLSRVAPQMPRRVKLTRHWVQRHDTKQSKSQDTEVSKTSALPAKMETSERTTAAACKIKDHKGIKLSQGCMPQYISIPGTRNQDEPRLGQGLGESFLNKSPSSSTNHSSLKKHKN